MKKLFFIFISLMWATSSFSSHSAKRLTHFNFLKKVLQASQNNSEQNEDGYTDFSGVWDGECDDGDAASLTISNTYAHIEIDNQLSFIDGMNKVESNKDNLKSSYALRLRWSPDGKEILANYVQYLESPLVIFLGLPPNASVNWVGNYKLSIQNNQLIQDDISSVFVNGVLNEKLSGNTHCVYTKIAEYDPELRTASLKNSGLALQ